MLDFEKTLIAREDLPLYGKRILFCTPRNYAAKLSRLLVLRGALPIWMPTIVIEPMRDYSEFDRAIRNLHEYRWIAFTSRNGIDAFFDRLEVLGLPPSIPAGVQTAALGNDGQALAQRGVEVNCLPEVATTRGIVDELTRRGENHGKILLPVPAVYGMDEPSVIPDFVGWLAAAGMDVHRVPAYATTRVTSGFEPEKRRIVAGDLDLIAFTSVAEIESLLQILGDQRDALRRCTLAFYGPMTAAGGKERGLQVDIMSRTFTAFEHYIDAIEQHFR